MPIRCRHPRIASTLKGRLMRFETTTDLLADIQLEAALVAALTADSSLVERIRDELTPAHFADPDLGAAYSALLEGRTRDAPVNAEPVADVAAAAARLRELAGGRHLAPAVTLLGQRLADLHRGDRPL